jgi:predicted RNase H-like HicB family nuclease
MSSNRYTVEVTREGDAWVADVVDLAGAHTFSRSYSALRRDVREVIGLVADLPDGEEFQINWRLVDFDTQFLRLVELGEQRERIEREAGELGRATEEALASVGSRYSVRDMSAALNLTPGRVSQIVTKNGGAVRAARETKTGQELAKTRRKPA